MRSKMVVIMLVLTWISTPGFSRTLCRFVFSRSSADTAEVVTDLRDDAIASCQVYQGFGISSCRCSAPQSSPPLPYACRLTPTSLHAHSCTSIRPGSLPLKKCERRQETSLNFENLGK